MHTEILTEAQISVLERLSELAAIGRFYLAGGTALALRYGHRRSIDFDFHCRGEPAARWRAPALRTTSSSSPSCVARRGRLAAAGPGPVVPRFDVELRQGPCACSRVSRAAERAAAACGRVCVRDCGSGRGSGCGSGRGSGCGSGRGSGCGSGRGSGCGSGRGSGCGSLRSARRRQSPQHRQLAVEQRVGRRERLRAQVAPRLREPQRGAHLGCASYRRGTGEAGPCPPAGGPRPGKARCCWSLAAPALPAHGRAAAAPPAARAAPPPAPLPPRVRRMPLLTSVGWLRARARASRNTPRPERGPTTRRAVTRGARVARASASDSAPWRWRERRCAPAGPGQDGCGERQCGCGCGSGSGCGHLGGPSPRRSRRRGR
ncbi:MAG: nucleotidyl transferase AbiEii/AbiGii toxin family protein [Deltaproteobacteria bacterium]|nr:nucleotidyl transferase AbiEii/AbiGii toxin family protein [Deltaproteobacteria bacterium]